MNQKQLSNPESEKLLLSCLIQYGETVFHDINSVVNSRCFTRPEHSLLYSAISNLINIKKIIKLDNSLVLKECEDLEHNSPAKYLLSDLLADMNSEQVSKENASHFAKIITRCSLLRELSANLELSKKSVLMADPATPILEIVSNAEKVFFDFNTKVISHTDETIKLSDSIDDLINHFAETKPTHMGIPTGFAKYDEAIGGGIRGPGVAMIGARAKCLSIHNTCLLTSNGLFWADELHKSFNDNELDFNLINRYGNQERPSNIISYTNQETVKISTRYGFIIECTKDHPLLIIKDGKHVWKDAGLITKNDFLVFRRNDNIFGDRSDISLDDAYMLGVITGDGCINNLRCSIANMDKEIIDLTYRYYQKIGVNTTTNTKGSLKIYSQPNNKARSYVFHNMKIIKDKIPYSFYDNDNNKVFLKEIRESKKEIVCSYLSGLFDTDGGIYKNVINISMKSEKLSIIVQSMLMNLGILSRRRPVKRFIKRIQRNKTYYTIEISSVKDRVLFDKIIGFKIKRKNDLLKATLNKVSLEKRDCVPNRKSLLQKIRSDIKLTKNIWFNNDNKSKIDNYNSQARGIRNICRDFFPWELVRKADINDINQLKTLFDSHYFYDRPKQTRKSTSDVFDYTMPKSESFIANSVISHNCGKTSFAVNTILNVGMLNIPVLYLDTEMTKEQIQTKMISNLSRVMINDVEHGVFADNMDQTEKIRLATKKFKELPISYHNISGFSHHQTISVIRRWINNTVGFDENGNLKRCLVVLDYLKTMDTREFKNVSEFQYLGQYITDLHNFCVPFKLPVLAFVQLNRDGIDREDSGAISGSDRLVWICTSFSILKQKTSEDYVEDASINGDRKLLVKDTRFGPGLDHKDYINLKTNLGYAIMVEGPTHKAVRKNKDGSQIELNDTNEDGSKINLSI